MLKFKDLHIGFHTKKDETELFSSPNLCFNKGEFIALIGPNGAGKTTLFNTILGHLKSLRGEIVIKERKLSTIPVREKVKMLSFVPSKFNGVNHLTACDLIAMGRAPYTNILNRLSDKDKAIIIEIIRQLELSHLANKGTLQLSDGERQIALIGKALAQETEVIILDEPTAFLDYNNRRKILHLLKNIAEKQQKIIFISTHDLSLSFEYCNRVIGIDKESKKLIDFNGEINEEEIICQIFHEELE